MINKDYYQHKLIPKGRFGLVSKLLRRFIPAVTKRFAPSISQVSKAEQLARDESAISSMLSSNKSIILGKDALQSSGSNGRTSLVLLQQPQSSISFAERLGIPKADRNNLDRFQSEALSDLEQFINSGQYRQMPSIIDGNIKWDKQITNNEESLAFYGGQKPIQYKGALIRPVPDRLSSINVYMPRKDVAGGEATISYNSLVLTSPKTSASIKDNDYYSIEDAPSTIPKKGMKTFWSVVADTRRPGSYFSGDAGRQPLGNELIMKYQNRKTSPKVDNYGNKVMEISNVWDSVIKSLFRKQKWFNRGDQGLSADSYLALLKQASRDNSPYSLRYSPDGAQFNDRGVENKFIYDLLEKTKTGEVSKQEFLKAFHDWVSPYGGMDAKIINGEIVLPHPFLYTKKHGGTLNDTNKEHERQ